MCVVVPSCVAVGRGEAALCSVILPSKGMMSHSELKSLSQEELRKRLYQTFKNKGVLDSLKTQLRNQLIQDLKHRTLSGDQLQTADVSGDSLLHRACNSLVADHMRRCGYEYSLSVFFPECGLEKEKVFTVNDLLQLMKINPKSRLHNSLTSSLQNSNAKGFLLQILKELIDYHLDKDGRDADTQTVTTSPYKDSIVDKLKFIDEQFEDMYPKRPKFESLEGKLLEYRREIAEQLQLELSQKLQHFKDVEIAKLKLEEREKSQREISDLRRELEKTYQLKCDGLVSREKNAVERLQRQQEIESKEIYAQRQTLLKEIEVVRSREMDLRQRMEAFELSQKLQEEKNKSVNEFLRKRELEVKNIEDTYEQKLKHELLRYQNELNEEYFKKTKKVHEDERKNKEEAAQLREDTIVLNMRKQELEQAISRTKQLEAKVNALKAQLSLATQQNHHLTEKLKEMVDYPVVKEEKLELQAQVKLLSHQLEELQRENQLLREKTSLPFPELLSLQEQLRKMETARKFDQDEFKIQREILEKQLELEIERGLEIKVQLLNREESSKRLSAQVEQLEFQLRQTQQALENEVYRIPRTSLLSHSVLDFPTNKIVRPAIYTEKPVFKSQHLMDSIGGISGQCRHAERTRSSSPDSDLEFVASTKARIKELEKEAEYLDEAYRNYHHRVLQTASIDRYPQAAIPSSRGYLGTKPAVLQHKVTFLEDNLTPQQHILLNRLKTQTYEGLLPSEVNRTPPQTKISSARRLSSTPVPKAAKSYQERASLEDNNGSYISSSHHSPNHRLSPIPKIQQLPMLNCDVPDTGVEAGIEQLPSAHQPEAANFDTSNHSKLEKLHPEGLNHSDSSLQDQEDIPEQLESDWSHPSEDFVHDIRVPADVPVTTNSLPVSFSDEDKADSPSHDKNVDRSKQIDPQESTKDPNKEHSEIILNADYQQEVLAAEAKTSAEEQAENLQGSNLDEVNPLDKYMHLLLQKGTEEQSDKVTKESMEDVSIEEKLFNESITAHSPGEADEDFW
ncbi:centriole and centriolar satellite protein OFD1 isoform X2 [Pseudophryne corroboree]|uniref:centriole and centriolar satellite protein OFD1 isoform X2 n=1 Tax=Pseudophryne corroboree TaxID=495146 RepID=UPI003081E419